MKNICLVLVLVVLRSEFCIPRDPMTEGIILEASGSFSLESVEDETAKLLPFLAIEEE